MGEGLMKRRKPYGKFQGYEWTSSCLIRKRWTEGQKCLHGFYRSTRVGDQFAYLKQIETCSLPTGKGCIAKIQIHMVARTEFYGLGSRIKWPVMK
jgi:hypothetical protein